MRPRTSPTTESASAGQRRGFTLIELMVVVLIIGVLSAMAIPQFMGSRERGALREEARSLAAAVRYARSEAVLSQRIVRLVWLDDVDDQKVGDQPGYRLEKQSSDPRADAAFEAMRGGAVKPRTLAAQVHVVRVIVPTAESGTAEAIRFYPTGRSDPAVVQLGAVGLIISVVVEPVTGAVRWVDAAVEQPPSLREDLDA